MISESFYDCIEWAFLNGANLSLLDVEFSDFFQSVFQKQQSLADKFPKNPLTFAHHVRENGKIYQDFLHRNRAQIVAEQNAWMIALGNALIHESKKLLPYQAYKLAADFYHGNSQEQLKACIALCELLRDKFEPKKYETDARLGELTHDVFDSANQPIERQLPAYLLKSDDNSLANCLMLTQLLSAWAELAGAKFLLADVITPSSSIVSKFVLKLFDLGINASIEDKHCNPSVLNELERYILIALTKIELEHNGFHSGIVVELKDGTWVLLDVFGDNWGLMDNTWNLKGTKRIVDSCSDYLPGYSHIVTDNGHADQSIVSQFEKLQDSLHHYSLMAKRERIKLNREISPFLRKHSRDYRNIFNPLADTIMRSEIYEFQVLLDGLNGSELTLDRKRYHAIDMAFDDGLFDDSRDTESAKHAFASFLMKPYLFSGMEFQNDMSRAQQGGTLRHPSLGFSKAAYGIGSRVFREVAWHLGLENEVLDAIWQSSTSQFCLYDQILLNDCHCARNFSVGLLARVKPLKNLLASIEAREITLLH